jgi:hypothetical protein
MTESTARPAPSGALMWWTTFGSIFLWMIHLTAEAALVPLHERHASAAWLMHGLTVVLALAVIAGMWISWGYTRVGEREGRATPAGRTVFLGWLGLGMGAFNLLLIVYEGMLIVALHHGGGI